MSGAASVPAVVYTGHYSLGIWGALYLRVIPVYRERNLEYNESVSAMYFFLSQ